MTDKAFLKKYISTIRAELDVSIDADYAKKIQTLVPSKNLILGVRIPVIKELAKRFTKSNALEYDTCLALMDELFKRGVREEILLGIFVFEKFKKHFSAALLQRVDTWLDSVENWEICDQLATRIAVVVIADDISHLNTLLKWGKSKNKWRRRFTLAIATGLNQKGRKFVSESLQVTKALMNDEEEIVKKAIGWVLREASKNDSGEVYEFMSVWKGKVSPRIIREGSEKLPDGLRRDLLAAN